MNDIQKIIDYYGEDLQLTQVIEELSELTKEVCKYLKGSDSHEQITEEIADVLLMIEQLIIICGLNHSDITKIMQEKLERTLQRIKK